jgi:hypothetical protein
MSVFQPFRYLQILSLKAQVQMGATCSLALHKENTTGRHVLLDVADKQPVRPSNWT